MGYVQKKNEDKSPRSCFTINSPNSVASEHSKYTVLLGGSYEIFTPACRARVSELVSFNIFVLGHVLDMCLDLEATLASRHWEITLHSKLVQWCA